MNGIKYMSLHLVCWRQVLRLCHEADGENPTAVHLLLRHVQVTVACGAAGRDRDVECIFI